MSVLELLARAKATADSAAAAQQARSPVPWDDDPGPDSGIEIDLDAWRELYRRWGRPWREPGCGGGGVLTTAEPVVQPEAVPGRRADPATTADDVAAKASEATSPTDADDEEIKGAEGRSTEPPEEEAACATPSPPLRSPARRLAGPTPREPPRKRPVSVAGVSRVKFTRVSRAALSGGLAERWTNCSRPSPVAPKPPAVAGGIMRNPAARPSGSTPGLSVFGGGDAAPPPTPKSPLTTR